MSDDAASADADDDVIEGLMSAMMPLLRRAER